MGGDVLEFSTAVHPPRGKLRRRYVWPETDADVLVEFIRGRRVGLRFITVQEDLHTLLGWKVHLNHLGLLDPALRDLVKAEAAPACEAA